MKIVAHTMIDVITTLVTNTVTTMVYTVVGTKIVDFKYLI